MSHRTLHPIQRAFARAGVRLRLVDDARHIDRRIRRRDGRSTREIFAMDIVTRRRDQEFVMSPGLADVHAINVSPRLQQIVLFVREPQHEFVITRWDRRLRKHVDETVDVPESRRHLLVGMDESHLFACRLPRAVPTVAAAHDALAPHSVRRDRTGVRRQGEWFFRRVDDVDTERALERAAGGDRALRFSRFPLGYGLLLRGRPHVADHVVILSWPDSERSTSRVRSFGGRSRHPISSTPRHAWARELARGCVRHPDHRTLDLGNHWHVVERNTEPVDAPPVPEMTWID